MTFGFTVRVRTVYVTCYDGVPIKWNSILPDIRVPQTEKDINNGIDKQLGYAIELLSRN